MKTAAEIVEGLLGETMTATAERMKVAGFDHERFKTDMYKTAKQFEKMGKRGGARGTYSGMSWEELLRSAFKYLNIYAHQYPLLVPADPDDPGAAQGAGVARMTKKHQKGVDEYVREILAGKFQKRRPPKRRR